MITTMTSVDIIEEAAILSDMIIASDTFVHYQQCRHKLLQDKKAQTLIRQFNEWKDRYEEVQRFGKYHPDYDVVSTEIRVAKRAMDSEQTVSNFKKAETELEQLLNEISQIIAHEVSEHIKVPTGNPYFDSMSCSGGCSTGGGCGCK
ncbi:YlbF family regulator [Alkalihalobacillus sp. LMS39]|uniref:YlbF family regulator n=1 Tax=Alkalihalobacillus sp. LMS39 TaxID=2924032 RepID=UPI001FB35393|nr:YlbF family regulator [Alkalihalobacillus sp. LMS39]UOE92955.1 YlbF family regulator [Alkalihalobacillus sp. LMS39]